MEYWLKARFVFTETPFISRKDSATKSGCVFYQDIVAFLARMVPWRRNCFLMRHRCISSQGSDTKPASFLQQPRSFLVGTVPQNAVFFFNQDVAAFQAGIVPQKLRCFTETLLISSRNRATKRWVFLPRRCCVSGQDSTTKSLYFRLG